jgi:hypothetical protein
MRKYKGFRSVTAIVIIIILMTTLLSISCGSIDNGYKKIITTKVGIRFSFECPSSYQDKNDTLRLNGSFLLNRVSDNSTWDNPDTTLYFFIYNPETYFPDAKSKIDELLKTEEISYPSANFKLLERSNINVAGIKGESLSYSVVYRVGVPRYFSYVYFDYKWLIWAFEIEALDPVSVQAKTEFDHIIKSFKFLD